MRGLVPSKVDCDYKREELFRIFKQENFNALVAFLDKNGGIDAVDEYHRTALMNCIIERNNTMYKFDKTMKPFVYLDKFAEKLIKLGADINKTDKTNYAAIHFCIQNRNIEILDVLLSHQNINLNLEMDLLMFLFGKDITNFKLMMRLIEMGVDPFQKKDKYPDSFYDTMKQVDDGLITRGKNRDRINVKPIMDFMDKLH